MVATRERLEVRIHAGPDNRGRNVISLELRSPNKGCRMRVEARIGRAGQQPLEQFREVVLPRNQWVPHSVTYTDGAARLWPNRLYVFSSNELGKEAVGFSLQANDAGWKATDDPAVFEYLGVVAQAHCLEEIKETVETPACFFGISVIGDENARVVRVQYELQETGQYTFQPFRIPSNRVGGVRIFRPERRRNSEPSTFRADKGDVFHFDLPAIRPFDVLSRYGVDVTLNGVTETYLWDTDEPLGKSICVTNFVGDQYYVPQTRRRRSFVRYLGSMDRDQRYIRSMAKQPFGPDTALDDAMDVRSDGMVYDPEASVAFHETVATGAGMVKCVGVFLQSPYNSLRDEYVHYRITGCARYGQAEYVELRYGTAPAAVTADAGGVSVANSLLLVPGFGGVLQFDEQVSIFPATDEIRDRAVCFFVAIGGTAAVPATLVEGHFSAHRLLNAPPPASDRARSG